MELSKTDTQIIKDFFIGKPVKRAFVFGSYARKEADYNSDLDIIVELDHSNEPIGINFFVFQNELEDLLHKKIDLVSDGGISKYIKPIIDKEKILIYERANKG